MRSTASWATVTLSLICLASVNCSTRSWSVTVGTFVLRTIANSCVFDTPCAVSVTL